MNLFSLEYFLTNMTQNMNLNALLSEKIKKKNIFCYDYVQLTLCSPNGEIVLPHLLNLASAEKMAFYYKAQWLEKIKEMRIMFKRMHVSFSFLSTVQ